jgi:cellulose synthase/poly-beta-1,6-N-acetylglucosamine synthase-like glycosyltransferase
VKAVFWLSIIGILYTYVGYPSVIWMIAWLRPRPWTVKAISPSVSIVLAVYDGAALLPRKIKHLLRLDYPNIKEIIIVSDGSTDGTAELLVSQSHPRLTTIILNEHAGKAVAVNAGVARATGDVILFVDIRPEIAPGAIQQLVSNFADPKVGCAAGKLILRQKNHDASSAAVSGIYWRYEEWIRTSESVCGSPVGVYGGFYAVRRELAVPQPAGIILDDMFLPLSIIHRGYRSVLDPQACAYDTWPTRIEDEFHRKVRTLAGNFQLFHLAHWTLTPRNPVFFQLVSHKLLRLVVPYLLVSLLISSLVLSRGSLICAALSVIQTLGWAAAIAGLRCKMPMAQRVLAPASALLALNAAAVIGLYRFVFARGPLWKIWTSYEPPAASTIPETGSSARKEVSASAAGNNRFTDSLE